MTEETVNNGAEEAAPVADDIRSTITAAIERQRAPKEPAAEAAETPAEDAEPKAESDGRARDENGRFKAQEKADTAPKEPAEPKEDKPEQPKADTKADASPDAPVRPPPGWSPKSKAAFDNLPAEVKADIAKREVEVNQGLAKLAEYKPIDRFNEMAKRGGTTLETALEAYTGIENTLRRDPIGGIEQICTNLKMDPRVLIGEMARRYGILQPGGQQPQAQPSAQQQIQLPPQLLEEITGLKSSLTQLQQERMAQEMNATTQTVETFFNDPKNKYADNVSEIMASLIKQAKANGERPNLASIYDQACWMHPEVRDLLINERLAANNPAVASNPAAKAQVAADQARQAAKAVTGAPSRGVPPSSAPPANESLRDTIKRAVAAQSGTV